MEEKDYKTIKGIRKILKAKNKENLAKLLEYSYGKLVESSTYGSYLFSVLSTYEIYSPPELNALLKNLPDKDKDIIFETILQFYPPKANSPEITSVEFIAASDVEVESKVLLNSLSKIDFEYISEQIEKCNKKITEKDFDGAITNARNLVESTLLYIIKEHNVDFKYNGKINKLYKRVMKLLNMDPSAFKIDAFKKVTSGCISIVDGIAEVRNKFGDAHGRSPKRFRKLGKRHTIFVVNISQAICEFLLSVSKAKLEK